jgi:hypothetical protein
MFPLIGLLPLFDARVRLVLGRTNHRDNDHRLLSPADGEHLAKQIAATDGCTLGQARHRVERFTAMRL